MSTFTNDSAQTTPQSPMALNDARQVRWPFDTKEPMGILLDRGELPRRKLEWAAKKARWPDVQRAAVTLLLALDALPPERGGRAPAVAALPAIAPPQYGPRVISGSDYLEAQESLHWGAVAFYLGLAFGLVALAIPQFLTVLSGQDVVVHSVALLLTALLGVVLAFKIRQQARRSRQYRIGRRGEAAVLEQIRTSLDQRWTIYRNLQLPASRTDIDLLLVGPGGVWAVQVKTLTTPVRVAQGQWFYRTGGAWRPFDDARNPAKQVSAQARQLYDFLGRQGIKRWVERAIALADGQPIDALGASEIPIWQPSTLREQLAGLRTRYPPSADDLATINTVLTTVVAGQRAAEQATKRR